MEQQWFRIFLVNKAAGTREEIVKVRSTGNLCRLLLLKLEEIYFEDFLRLEVEDGEAMVQDFPGR